MGVKKTTKIGECITLKRGAINTNHHNLFFSFVKLPSFSGGSDPNLYIGWEAKVEQIFNVYEVNDDKKFKLASLEFVDYAMHQ